MIRSVPTCLRVKFSTALTDLCQNPSQFCGRGGGAAYLVKVPGGPALSLKHFGVNDFNFLGFWVAPFGNYCLHFTCLTDLSQKA